MTTVNIQEATSKLSSLIDRAVQGETVIIAKSGRPVAKLVPLKQPGDSSSKPRLGFMDGQIKVPEDFDRMMEDEIAEMFGK